MVEFMSSPPDPTPSSESVKIELIYLIQSLSSPSLLVESELKPLEFFTISFDCSVQVEVFYLSTEPSPSSEVISFDWSNLT